MKKLFMFGVVLSVMFAGVVGAPVFAVDCGEGYQEVSISVTGEGQCVKIGDSDNVQDNIIFRYLVAGVNFLAVGVGLAVTGGIIYGAFLYLSARDNASQTSQGKTVIINAVIGLLLFIFMYTILQFIIPGGVFN